MTLSLGIFFLSTSLWASSNAPGATFAGRWDTTYGEMFLAQDEGRVAGRYGTGGRLEGRLCTSCAGGT